MLELLVKNLTDEVHLDILEIGEKHTRCTFPLKRCKIGEWTRYVWRKDTDSFVKELEEYTKDFGLEIKIKRY